MTESSSKEAQKNPPKSYPPPTLAIVVIVGISSVFMALFPSFEEIDKVATIKLFTRRVFPDQLSLLGLAVIRTGFALLVFTHSVFTVFFYEGWKQKTPYFKESKLMKNVVFNMKGYRTQIPFTSCSWNLIGASFALSSYIAWMGVFGYTAPQWVLRWALISFETVAPTSLLVSAVTSHVIWPAMLADTGDSSGLSNFRTLLWHDANCVMILLEIAFLGGIPLVPNHFATTPLFGSAYVIFTWVYRDQWSPENGSQFLYHFFDTTLGPMVTVVLLSLLFVLMTFYGILSFSTNILELLGGTVWAHAIFVLVLARLVCRFRD